MPPMQRPSPLALFLALLAVAALAAPAQAADTPNEQALYADGPSGRHLLDGEWLFRADPRDQGLRSRWQRQTGRAGWSAVQVPHAWNVGDDSLESFGGGVGWYRKELRLPSARAALAWAVRFESANYRSRVWLNGRPVGTNKGAYIPFEFRLGGLDRTGVNRLVVRVDSRRRPTDFPPAGLNAEGAPTGGWWNYGGLTREAYLRRIDTLDWAGVVVRPLLETPAGPARVLIRATLRNATGRAVRARVTGSFGGRRVALGTRVVGPNGIAAFERTIRLARARLWSPDSPYLYPVSLQARAGGRTVARYDLRTGVRSIERTQDGALLLNGRRLNVRGVGVHEDSREQGFAVDNAFRERLVAETKAVGATMLRTHYPMHPYTHELADREGLLIWSEIPVYAVKTKYLAQRLVRQLAAKELRRNIEANQNHASVLIWSLGNELSSRPGPVQGYYIQAATRLAKALDPSRPVGLAVAGYPTAGCQPEYGPLDVIGINEYFGWYPGQNGQLFDRTQLSPFLDAVRQCYPGKAIMVTEFGAEANRDGPVEEKGTWAFQQDFVNYHLDVHDSKPWLSGSLYWALNEFRVRPAWEGGNPRPTPPIHQKGLLTYGELVRKPAWGDVERRFRATQQIAPRP